MLYKVRYVPFGACSQKEMDEKEGPCVQIQSVLTVYICIYSQYSLIHTYRHVHIVQTIKAAVSSNNTATVQ